VVAYAASGTPEINAANATLSLQGTWQLRTCIGEDLIHYRTYTASTWVGNETQAASDVTDHGLTGPVRLTMITWTINNATQRGVLTGTIALTTASGALVYGGALTLVTQGFPTTTPSAYGRGWMQPRIVQADEAVTPGDDSLLANVQFKLGLTTAQGEFGNVPPSFGVPSYSVETNVAAPASDGVC
jgi:hypothetical protein